MSTRHSQVSSLSSEDPEAIARTFVTQDFIIDCKGKTPTPTVTPPDSRLESKNADVANMIIDVETS